MKKLLYSMIIVGTIVTLCFSSCSDYLNFEYIFKDEVSLDSVFEKRKYTEQWLADVYQVLRRSENIMIASKKQQPFNFLGDDMYYADYPQEPYWMYKNGWYGEGHKQGTWFDCYNGIRKASVFIHNVDRNLEMTPEEILDSKGQARFVRAYCYWLLLRRYGPIILMPDEGIDYRLQYDELALPRSTYEKCAEFIASEMALAAREMQIQDRGPRDITRATPGAALAVRARTYLYAASPLFNGNDDPWAKQLVDDQGNRLISPITNEELWAKAAAAAKDVMDLHKYNLYIAPVREVGSEGYPKTVTPKHPVFEKESFPDGWANIDPFESYRSVFNGAVSATDNPEFIFTHGQNQNSENIEMMILHHMPRSLGGWNCHGATLKQANAYYMEDGTDHYAFEKEDPTKGRPEKMEGYTETDDEIPYLRANVAREFGYREPRFYASLAFNGTYWDMLNAPPTMDANKQTFYYRGTTDGQLSTDGEHVVLTGIGIKKYYHPTDYFETREDVGSFKGRNKPNPEIRYAEILLIYAEALNELKEPHNLENYKGEPITVRRDISEMKKGMKPIRMRAGVPDFTDTVYANQDEFRKVLKRERQIELFAETHRYYDLRRWKDVEEEEKKPVWGYNMIMTTAQKDQWHIPVKIPSLPNIFVEKTYLWPISHDELRKNKKLTQNPGWTYYD